MSHQQSRSTCPTCPYPPACPQLRGRCACIIIQHYFRPPAEEGRRTVRTKVGMIRRPASGLRRESRMVSRMASRKNKCTHRCVVHDLRRGGRCRGGSKARGRGRAEDMDRVRTNVVHENVCVLTLGRQSARVVIDGSTRRSCGECCRPLSSSRVLMSVISQIRPWSSLSGRRCRCGLR